MVYLRLSDEIILLCLFAFLCLILVLLPITDVSKAQQNCAS